MRQLVVSVSHCVAVEFRRMRSGLGLGGSEANAPVDLAGGATGNVPNESKY